MTAYLDGKGVLSANDSSLTHGMAGLYCHGNAGTYFDDFVVESLEGVVGNAWSDTDGDGVDNDLDKCPETPEGVPVDQRGCHVQEKVVIEQGNFQLESGRITLTHEWKQVSFTNPFTYPVVVAKPLSYNGTDPATVEIAEVTPEGFRVRIHEWSYTEASHIEETLSYLAVERGHFVPGNGLEIEADIITTNVTGAGREKSAAVAQRVHFFSGFPGNPIVFAARASINGEDTVATRIDRVTPGGLSVLMQEQESNEQSHVYETISYIAINPGPAEIGGETLYTGRAKVTHEPSTITLPTGDKIEVHVDEEQSSNEETDHNEESVGYLFFSSNPHLFLADIQTIWCSDTANLRYEVVPE